MTLITANHPWHLKDINSLLEELHTTAKGLTTAEAQDRIATHGPNELVAEERPGPLVIFLNQFRNPMVAILMVAILISIAASFMPGHGEEGGIVDAVIIGAIVIANAVFGFVQEYRSERALEALKEMAAPKARVMRDGLWTVIESRYLVPGDLIALESGDRVPADGRLISSVGLGVDESILTGESRPSHKTQETLTQEKASISERKNMVYQGTIVTSGKGRAIVTATGMLTEFGAIARSVQQSAEIATPLQHDLEDLGRKLGVVVVLLAALVLAAEVVRNVSGSFVEELMAAIALAVSAIPEGLPAVVTITLAIGVQRMVQRNAIVRRLPSVETLGSTTVICSDKTGTITKNEMTATVIYADGKLFDVSGTGYNKAGDFTYHGTKVDPLADPQLRQVLLIGQLCSNTVLQSDPTAKADYSVVGDPTEGALMVLAEKGGLSYSDTITKYREVHEISFDSIRKRMTSVVTGPEGDFLAFTKGAPEVVVALCKTMLQGGRTLTLDSAHREEIARVNSQLAEKALRVLALAYRPLGRDVTDFSADTTERDLIFAGLVGMIDPPREEVRDAIQLCKSAGIRAIMITGDNQLTAKAVAQGVGLIGKDASVMTGPELDELNDEAFRQCVFTNNVFARVAPEHKLRIVAALRSAGNVVAMTGDGVNDAPAIKSADIGISMGIRGADVTKEASDVVLVDDNFATIVSAVEKGREIYSNIRKFVRFLLSSNFDELFLVFTIVMIGLPLPITAVQILWLNLVTDGLPALALGVDPPEQGLMKRPPRKPGAKLMDRRMGGFIVLSGLVAFLGAAFVFLYSLYVYGGYIPGFTGEALSELEWRSAVSSVTGLAWADVLTHARTAVFASVVAFELLFVWNCRDEYNPVWRSSLKGTTYLFMAVLASALLTLVTIYVPFVQPFFKTVPLTLSDWAVVLLASLPALLIPSPIIFGHRKLRRPRAR
ncbi:MAG: cation-translocating P-type ATPase [Candidatus Thorarchaeota archaeon]|nr:cation-translocating P-type ATPase [Candidatus Thorarchaeota archaeon]